MHSSVGNFLQIFIYVRMYVVILFEAGCYSLLMLLIINSIYSLINRLLKLFHIVDLALSVVIPELMISQHI